MQKKGILDAEYSMLVETENREAIIEDISSPSHDIGCG